MINIVQVYYYKTNNGCSVRVGRGLDYTMPLDSHNCEFFDFVETKSEVKKAINKLKKLSSNYRMRDRGIDILKYYLGVIEGRNTKLYSSIRSEPLDPYYRMQPQL